MTAPRSQQTAPGESPGGPRPVDDVQEQQVPEYPVEDGEARAERVEGDRGDAQDQDEERRGFPAGQWLAGGATGVAILGQVLWQTLGMVGLVAGAGAAAGGAALYVRRRLSGRQGGSSGATRTVRTATVRTVGGAGRLGGRAGGLGSMFGGGRGRGAGASGRGGRGAGRGAGGWFGGGRGGGAGASGRAGMRMPGVGGRGRAASAAAGTAGSSGKGGSAGGRSGKGAAGKGGSAAASGAGRPGRVARAARAVAHRVDAATGGRAGRAARAAGRWIDAKTGGRASKAVRAGRRAWRRYQASETPARRWARWGVFGGVLGLAMGVPTWLLVGGAAACGGLAWWTRRRKGRRKDGQKQDQGEGQDKGDKDRDDRKAGQETASQEQQQKQQEQRQEGQADAAGTEDKAEDGASESPRPDPEKPGRDHGNTSTYTPRRRHMSTNSFPLAVAAAEVNVAAASYAPADMWAVAADMRQLPDMFASVALGLRTYVQRLEGAYAIDQTVVQQLGQLYLAMTQVAQAAQEIEPLFRRVHAADLARGENPRVGEEGWNV